MTVFMVCFISGIVDMGLFVCLNFGDVYCLNGGCLVA